MKNFDFSRCITNFHFRSVVVDILSSMYTISLSCCAAAVLISNVHEGAIQNYWTGPFLSHHLCRKMVWHANIEFFCTWLENCQFALLWCTHDPPQDSPTRRQLRTFSLVHKIYPRPPCRVFLCFCGRHSRENETEAPETNECLSTMSLIKV